jgi:YfiH family protein
VTLGQQCHGTLIHDVDHERSIAIPVSGRSEFPDCDGLMTRAADCVIAVRTADCVPIVVSDAARPWLGAVHAGWRGTLAGILSGLLNRAISEGSRPTDLHLWIGPHIHACHYEVGQQLSEQFCAAFGEQTIGPRSRHLSLLEANLTQAARAGVPLANIHSSGLCTYEEKNNLPSYRRDGRCRGEIITAAHLTIA